MTQLPILGQPALEPPRGVPLFRLAFRPFYLLASGAFVVLLPLWIAVLRGEVTVQSGLDPSSWHGHEMIFGVVCAVVVGFLFTAGKTWTGLPTPRGGQLALLAALWLAARIAAVLGPADVFAWLDLAFLPLCLAAFLSVLAQASNRRNYVVAAVLGLLAAANLAFHLANWGVARWSSAGALRAGVAGLVLMETLIAGRVVPFFTRNVNPGLQNAVPLWRERVLGVSTLAALGAWLVEPQTAIAAATAAIAAVLHAWRLWSWRPRAALSRPILWSLHLAYAWIPGGFGLLAFAELAGGTDSSALHAFTVGATGGLLIAMMTRTARGHTARPLQVGRVEVLAYGLVALAGAARVAAPYLPEEARWSALVFAAGAFALAFALYVMVYAPWLASPRLDGKDG